MELQVAPEHDGERLDVVLAGPLGSRSRAARLIDAGAVTVDGAVVARRHRVRAGARVTIADDAEPRAPADLAAGVEFAVPYEDEHVLVVDKPAGLVVHPARGHHGLTLAEALAGVAAGGDEGWRAGIVHRLDRETSGLLVVAKDDAAHRALKEQLQAREVVREYLALVEGRPPARSGTIDAPIGRDRKARTRQSTDTDTPREAVTHFELERALSRTTLLRLRLETGRTHQIRVHLQAIGHPVCGDPEYGGGRSGAELGLARQFLHAARLVFRHPASGAPVEVTSPLPPDLQAALVQAERGPDHRR